LASPASEAGQVHAVVMLMTPSACVTLSGGTDEEICWNAQMLSQCLNLPYG
jgi:hypothetical protein